MNFVGHLAIARSYAEEPAFWLGAMLPDLASMAGVRLPSRGGAEPGHAVGRGVAHHHAVDDVFHAAEAFVALTQRGVEALTALAVPRGSARAVAHVGVELLLDGALDGSGGLERDYQAALASASTDELARYAGAVAAPLEAVRRRLMQHGYPHAYGSPSEVARFVVGLLRHRPRLALPAASTALVADVLGELAEPVRRALPEISAAVHAGLRRRVPPHNER